MKTTKKLIKSGDSLVIVIDSPICKKLNLVKGDLVEIDFKKVE